MPTGGNVGEMSRAELARFVQQAVFATPATLPKSLSGEDIEAFTTLIVSGDITLSTQAVKRLKTYLGL